MTSICEARFKNKVALITAAAQGIGKATALRLASEGCHVIATDINETALKSLENVTGIDVRRLDVTNPDDISRLASEVKRLDILFNCAGYVHQGSILECDENVWDRSVDLNVKSMFRMCKAFIPKLLENSDGDKCVINMASVCSSLKGADRRFVYGTTKGAVLGLTKSIAIDFVKQGLRALAICPGTVDTPSFRERVQAFPDPDKAYSDFVARQKMRRLGSAEEIAGLVAFLASPEASYMTGTEVVIDGGWSI